MTANLPLSIGVLHFIGIGGIGMSGIAEVLKALGYNVSGSDIIENSNVIRLRKFGIKISIGHKKINVIDAKIIVVSSAIDEKNEELLAARELKIPIVHRSEMLCELMRLKWSVAIAGTHGKTTTTSIISSLLYSGGFDPTIINGGIIKNWESNARLGKGDWMVVEADESDGSFNKLIPTVAVLTNIDPEHLDYYGSVSNLEKAFQDFISSIPFYGFKVLCIDHPAVQNLIPLNKDRRLLTYGQSTSADVRAVSIKFTEGHSSFDLILSDRMICRRKVWHNVKLPMLGIHNVLNCLAGIAVALEMGIPENLIRNSLVEFKGIKRRFEIKGKSNCGITVIDDYGHHPIEIKYALSAARELAKNKKVIAIVQPHRYTRLKELFEDFCSCFNDADIVYVSDVFSAGEKPISDFNKNTLASGITDHGHQNVLTLNDPKFLAKSICKVSDSDDIVILLGAGSITNWSNKLVDELNECRESKC